MGKRIAAVLLLSWLTVLGALAASAAVGPNLKGLFPSMRKSSQQLASLGASMSQVSPAVASDRQFTIFLPSAQWEQSLGVEYLEGSKGLAAFQSPKGPQAGCVAVSCLELEKELNPMEWLRLVADAGGWQGLRLRWERGKAGPVFNMLAFKQPAGGAKLLARMGVYRVGSLLFVVHCSADEANFAELAKAFAVTTLFFKPDNSSNPTLAGPWEGRCLQQGLCFFAPGPGRYQGPAPKTKVEGVTFPMTHENKPAGALQVWAAPAQSGQGALAVMSLKYFLASLIKRGFKAGQVLDTRSLQYQRLQGKAYYFRQALSKDGQPWEIMHLTLATPSTVAAVWMLTPGPQSQPVAWAYNKRAFDVVAWSLQPSQGVTRHETAQD